jgi:hypothetical protein
VGAFLCLHYERVIVSATNKIDNDEYEAHVKNSVDAFGPLTAEQVAKLSALFDYEPPKSKGARVA